MGFTEAFQTVKSASKSANGKMVDGHLAIQINLTDPDASGICYLEVDKGSVKVEPYDYYDHDALFTVSSSDMAAIFRGKLAYEKAIDTGRLMVTGDTQRAALVKQMVSPAPRKPRTKAAKPETEISKPASRKPGRKPKAEETAASVEPAPAVNTPVSEKQPAAKQEIGNAPEKKK